jgi:effector-binding domain-containing protein
MVKSGYAFEQAFEKTEVGVIAKKIIPASRLLISSGEGNYFDRRNNLFYRLFRYISDNDVAMTSPVEAEIGKASMKFYVGNKDKEKDLSDNELVKIISVPERKVVSIGVRGAYNKKNFDEAKAKVEQWLQENQGYTIAGEAYAVFWNGPYVPWFLKRSEVHIPIQ